jgi:peptidoglycan/LPS O-acetylase OafA/YrhL
MLLYGYTFIGLLYGSFLLIVVDRNAKLRLKKIFSSTPLVFLGKYSYSLYIFHWPLYRLLRDPIKELFGQMVWTGQPFAINFLSSSAILILTVLCSLITWNLFEKRFIALKSILVPRTKEVKQSFNS